MNTTMVREDWTLVWQPIEEKENTPLKSDIVLLPACAEGEAKYTHTHTHTYTYIYLFTYTYACVYTCVYACVYACVCVSKVFKVYL